MISSGTGEYQESEEVIGECAARIANRKRISLKESKCSAVSIISSGTG